MAPTDVKYNELWPNEAGAWGFRVSPDRVAQEEDSLSAAAPRGRARPF